MAERSTTTYIVAVSGGIDSVVLLDMLLGEKTTGVSRCYVVAHVDHGIRPDSAEDARFVRALCERYGAEFRETQLALGPKASEDVARRARYKFLNSLAQEYGATILTAHHKDDVLETISLNIKRGTGWRGLAPMSPQAAETVQRPLLRFTKAQLYDYACENGLEWVEDETNNTDAYTRNRLRRKINSFLKEDDKVKLFTLWQQQCVVREAIDLYLLGVVGGKSDYARYLFIMSPSDVAVEMVRYIIKDHSGRLPTYPQAYAALLAIKTAHPGSRFDIMRGVRMRCEYKRFFIEKTTA